MVEIQTTPDMKPYNPIIDIIIGDVANQTCSGCQRSIHVNYQTAETPIYYCIGCASVHYMLESMEW